MTCQPFRHEWKISDEQSSPSEGAPCLCGDTTFSPADCELATVPSVVDGSRQCWMCLRDADDPIHEPGAHLSCSSDCEHHSFEYEPNGRTALLNYMSAVRDAQARDRAELARLCGPICPHEGRRAVEHTYLLARFGEDGLHPAWPEAARWHEGLVGTGAETQPLLRENRR